MRNLYTHCDDCGDEFTEPSEVETCSGCMLKWHFSREDDNE